jgi:hypothetical protein
MWGPKRGLYHMRRRKTLNEMTEDKVRELGYDKQVKLKDNVGRVALEGSKIGRECAELSCEKGLAVLSRKGHR